MQRALICDQLDRAERHVVDSRKRISEQLEFIAWLTWFGHDTTGAKALLREFERGLAKHIADGERLRTQLTILDGTKRIERRPSALQANRARIPDFKQFDEELAGAVNG
jgi:hypothetical protein